MIDYIQDAETCLEKADFVNARRYFSFARRDNPDDWRAWFGLARALTHDFTVIDEGNWKKFTDRARLLADDEGRRYMDSAVGQYYHAIEEKIHGGNTRLHPPVFDRKLSSFRPVVQEQHSEWSEKDDRIFGTIMILIAVLVITSIVFLAIWGAH